MIVKLLTALKEASEARPSLHLSKCQIVGNLMQRLKYHFFAQNIVLFTFGEGTTEYVLLIRSGNSSLILEINNVPIPEPVPPPSEWHN